MTLSTERNQRQDFEGPGISLHGAGLSTWPLSSSYSLNDLHVNIILTDDDWNLRCLIDLKWACSRPIEMLHSPHRFESVDTIEIDLFEPVHQEFISILEGEENLRDANTITRTFRELYFPIGYWTSRRLFLQKCWKATQLMAEKLKKEFRC
ncbi:hypothetical protein ACO22_00413 [Paracoccidioides brasiliensis]|uniref:Aminoglycoside phosphotransferase domain-containing protein n=1 Tax=Paracoccidioides brasiliensis TaxID=121759 RepID=A0A1D2JPK5_PARBR|nr:hypothetical protein ACO22_00413 [Paracoccidioides brasiliensis]